jgi:hypothetical protein
MEHSLTLRDMFVDYLHKTESRSDVWRRGVQEMLQMCEDGGRKKQRGC